MFASRCVKKSESHLKVIFQLGTTDGNAIRDVAEISSATPRAPEHF